MWNTTILQQAIAGLKEIHLGSASEQEISTILKVGLLSDIMSRSLG